MADTQTENWGRNKILQLIETKGKEAGYSRQEIAALNAWAQTESGFKANAFNPTNANGTTDSGTFQFNSATVADMKRQGKVAQDFNPNDPNQAVPAAFTYFNDRVRKHIDNPQEMYRAINGPAAKPENIQRFVNNYAGFLGVSPTEVMAQEGGSLNRGMREFDANIAEGMRNVAAALGLVNQAGAKQQADLVAARDQSDQAFKKLYDAIGLQAGGELDKILADGQAALETRKRAQETRNTMMPDTTLSSWAAQYRSNMDEALKLGDEIKAKQAVGFFDDPVKYIVSQFQLPENIAQYNMTVRQGQVAQSAITGAVDAIKATTSLDKQLADLQTEETTKALAKISIGRNAEKLGHAQVQQVNQMLALGNNNFSSAMHMLQAAQLPIDLQFKEMQRVLTIDAMQTKQDEKVAKDVLAAGALDLFGIPYEQGKAGVVFDQIKNPAQRKILIEAATGSRGENVAQVLENVQELGAGIFRKNPNQDATFTKLAGLYQETKEAADKEAMIKGIKTPAERQQIHAGLITGKLAKMQEDLSSGGTSNIYAGLSPAALFGDQALPGPTTPRVSPEFKDLVQNALKLGTIRIGSEQQTSDLIHAVMAGKKEGLYKGSDAQLVKDIVEYGNKMVLATNSALDVAANRILPLNSYKTTVLVSPEIDKRNTAPSFFNVFQGKQASNRYIYDLTRPADVQRMLTQIQLAGKPVQPLANGDFPIMFH